MDRNEVVKELRRVQADFHQLSQYIELLTCAAAARARAGRTGSCCYMVFGYGIVRRLLPLVHTLGRLNTAAGSRHLNASYRRSI